MYKVHTQSYSESLAHAGYIYDLCVICWRASNGKTTIRADTSRLPEIGGRSNFSSKSGGYVNLSQKDKDIRTYLVVVDTPANITEELLGFFAQALKRWEAYLRSRVRLEDVQVGGLYRGADGVLRRKCNHTLAVLANSTDSSFSDGMPTEIDPDEEVEVIIEMVGDGLD